MELTKRKEIISWCLFDWANSAFPTCITTFIFAAYFTSHIAENPIIGTAKWGSVIAAAGIIVALVSPLLGALADYSGRRKPWLGAFTVVAVIATAALWFAKPSQDYESLALAIVIIAGLGFEFSLVFYNAMLPNLATRDYFGRVSGWGWGLGYAGGLLALTVALIIQIKSPWLDTKAFEHIRITGPFVALWFFIFSLPLFFFVKEPDIPKRTIRHALKYGLAEFISTLKNLLKQKTVIRFLIARMIYSDGLVTLFTFGGIYAAGTFGMSIKQVVVFGIVMNILAGLGAASFAWIDDAIGSRRTILISLVGLILFGSCIIVVASPLWFWIYAALLSIFVGPVQAASRALMARLIPAEKSTEMFGLFAFSGKATAFLGPWLLGMVTLYTQSQRLGMLTIILFFVIGALLLWFLLEPQGPKGSRLNI